MFDEVTFRAFKCLADVNVKLSQLTVLVGANGSGKSSVLDGLDLLCQLVVPHAKEQNRTDGRFGAVFAKERAPDRLRTHDDTRPLHVAAKFDGGFLSVTSWPNEVSGKPWNFLVEGAKPGTSLRVSNNSDPAAGFPKLTQLAVGGGVRLMLDPAAIAGFAPDVEVPRVAANGGGVASVISLLAEQRSKALDAIESDLRKVVPRARELLPVRAARTPSGPGVSGRRFQLKFEGGDTIPADLLSEGTLLAIGLLTVLHQPPVPRLILLDDLDRALHPRAQHDLIKCLRSVLESHPDLQIVCTTHSPYVLNYFDAEEVRVLHLDDHGRTRCRALNEHAAWQEWKKTMKAGEFWSFVGEDWLDDAKAEPAA